MTSTQQRQGNTACEQFFSIDELVTLFLEKAPNLVLLNCQRVCRKWNEMIQDSETLQQHLFLSPSEDQTTPTLNPILWQRFNSILATHTYPHHSTPQITYADLSQLPWARDGEIMDARARQAFARDEASWRGMYISQPPITRMDWWHSWSMDPLEIDDDEENWGRSGWGHQDLESEPITLGLLWDLLESRLFRECEARICYFPDGMDPAEDETASPEEVEWVKDSTSQLRGFTVEMPRVRLTTYQSWTVRPWRNHGFDFTRRQWEIKDQRECTHGFEADGFNVLRFDCMYDLWEEETDIDDGEDPRRWSRHDDFSRNEIHGESSGTR